MEQVKKFIFKIFFIDSFCNTFLTKFLLILPIDPSGSIQEFYMVRLQSLTKESFTKAKKNFSQL